MGLDDMVRLIIDKNDVLTNIALDESTLELVDAGKVPETVRIYEFTKPAICIGKSQSMSEVNQDVCAASGWDVCVRNTGGTLAYLNPLGKIAVSRIYRKEIGDVDGVKHTRALCKDIIYALNDLGVKNVELWNKCDIMALHDKRWKKIGSAACYLNARSALAHATINYHYPAEDLHGFFRAVKPFGKEIPHNHLESVVEAASGFVTSVKAMTGEGKTSVYSALKKHFAKDAKSELWTNEECVAAESRISVIRSRQGGSDLKGLCDFGLGAYVPAFVLNESGAIAIPDNVMLELSERHSLNNGSFRVIQQRDKNEQLSIYNAWLSSLGSTKPL